MSAKDFFASLYEKQPTGIEGNFDAAVTRIVSRQGSSTVVGDQALQSLMLNYVLSSSDKAEKGKAISAALAGIKQMAVDSFVSTFPGVSLDQLIQEASAAGHKIEVLGTK
ncbi:hypothetical protein ACK9YZ_16975 [Rhizobium sp. ZK1]|uniref:hypothetical protein n=1 Tax=Rhizobium sp. ZK1 TaxID=3389872 RepID=UPI0039F68A69